MKAAAIDLGSSFVKAALLDMDHGCVRELEKRTSPPRKEYQDKLLFEVPAMDYVEIIRELLERWSRQYPDLECLLLSTQMHGFVYDPEGEGSCPAGDSRRSPVYISWQDMRCLHRRDQEDTYLSWLQKRFSRKDMEDCGVYIKPSLGMCNLVTLLEENPDLPGDGTLYTLGSYVISRLTGRNICHITNAACWGLVDVRNGCWSARMVEAAGLAGITLPELAPADDTLCGIYRVNGCEIRVYPDYGDQQIAVLGSMAGDGDGLVNIATAAQVSRISRTFVPGNYEVRPYFEGKYLNTVSNMPSGRGLDVLVKFLLESTQLLDGRKMTIGDFWKTVEKQFVYDPKGLQVDMSFYATPDKLDGGEILGITQNNLDINSLFSAAFRNMADTYRKHLEGLPGEGAMEQVVCSGGVSWKRPELVVMIGTVMGKPCRRSPLDDEALAGLYRMALLCGGICSSLEDRKDRILKDNRPQGPERLR